MKVFLDANVLFSAGATSSATRRLLDALLRQATAVTNHHAWEEAWRNLDHKRPEHLQGLLALRSQVIFSEALRSVDEFDLPDKDQPILGAAVGAGCTHLWTSDQRHFGKFYGQTILGVRVISSVMLADELLAKGWLKK
jgi:predicted nucleic acid-binding protein